MKMKTSYGIALCNTNINKNNITEILLIKKRFSYHFLALVMGHYKKNDTNYIKYLFNNISTAEKIDILGLQFSQMWYRIWLNIPEKFFNLLEVYKYTNFNSVPLQQKYTTSEIHKLYFQKKDRYEKNFLRDGGKRLRSLIQQSSDAEIFWEIPKGGKNDNETNIDCAIREFYEETNIKKDKYTILYDTEPVINSFIDNDTIYKSIYYLATLNDKNDNFIPKISFRNFEQISEVEMVRFVSILEVKFFNLQKPINDRLMNLYKLIIEKFKIHNKLKKIKVLKL